MEMREYDITSHKITITDADGGPLDLTDYIITVKTKNSSSIKTWTSITYEEDDPTTGIFFVELDLVAIPLQVGAHTFEVYLDGSSAAIGAQTVIYETLIIKESFANE